MKLPTFDLKHLTNSDIFVSRTRLGRQIKIALFLAGIVVPLGTLIWLALLAHGRNIRKGRLPVAAATSRS